MDLIQALIVTAMFVHIVETRIIIFSTTFQDDNWLWSEFGKQYVNAMSVKLKNGTSRSNTIKAPSSGAFLCHAMTYIGEWSLSRPAWTDAVTGEVSIYRSDIA